MGHLLHVSLVLGTGDTELRHESQHRGYHSVWRSKHVDTISIIRERENATWFREGSHPCHPGL